MTRSPSSILVDLAFQSTISPFLQIIKNTINAYFLSIYSSGLLADLDFDPLLNSQASPSSTNFYGRGVFFIFSASKYAQI